MAVIFQTDVENSISPGDRLSFTVFLAVTLHAAIILGITFRYFTSQPSTHTMEITLAQQHSKKKPTDPDFLAQVDQMGSGTLEEKQLLTSPAEATFHDTQIRATSQILPQQVSIQHHEKKTPIITTKAESNNEVYLDESFVEPIPQTQQITAEKSLRRRALEIASLHAKLDRQQQLYAKRPRIKRLTSLSTASSSDAYYLNSWRRKIENIGNLNYPEEARKKQLYGSLRLMVAIAPDGALRAVELLESSGHKALDDAAIRIVRLASPFAPFPHELRQTTDILEIIRTWQFRKNSSLRSY